MNPTVLHWFAAGAVIIGALISICRPDNTAFPIALAPPTRILVAVGLGAVQTCLQAIVGGEPWVTALGTAVAAVLTALLAHGFRGDPPTPAGARRGFAELWAMGAVLVLAAVGVAGCTWWNSGGSSKVADAGTCIFDHAVAGEDVKTIAKTCFVAEAQVIESVLASQDPKVNGSRAAGESRAARAAMAAVDGGS